VIYFDTAYIAKCYLDEPGAAQVRALAEGSEGLCSCEIARAEFFATIHRHFREDRIGRSQLRQVLSLFEEEEHDGVWTWLPAEADVIRSACEKIRDLPRGVFVRAADALHLCSARENGHDIVYTNDRHMLAAAKHFGVVGENVMAAQPK
jgi:predicted nucleic acid-binding protein